MKFRNKSPESHNNHDYYDVPGTSVLSEQDATTWDNIGQRVQFQEQAPDTSETEQSSEKHITRQKNKLRYALLTGVFPNNRTYNGEQPLDQDALEQANKDISEQNYSDNYVSSILQQITTPVHSKNPDDLNKLRQDIVSDEFTALIFEKASNSGAHAQKDHRPDLLSAINNYPTPIEFRKFANELDRTLEKPKHPLGQSAFDGMLQTAIDNYERMMYGKRKEYYDVYNNLYVETRMQTNKNPLLGREYTREERREQQERHFDPAKRAPGQAVILNSGDINRENYHSPASKQPIESSHVVESPQPQSTKKRGFFNRFRKSK